MAEDHPDRDFTQPWGSWFTLDEDGRVVDDEGRAWPSVRQAMMNGRLRMPAATEDYALLANVLLAKDRAPDSPLVEIEDLFGGDRRFKDFYDDWLVSQDLLEDDRLTPEGRSVLLMLAATQDYEDGPLPVGDDEVAAGPADDSDAAREAWFAEIDRVAAGMPGRFHRETIGGSPVIVSIGRAGVRIKFRRTLWSQRFGSVESRDLIYRWLAMRVHRWPDWVGSAWNGGRDGLTAELFSLLAADLADHAARIGRPTTVDGGQ